MLQGIRNKLRGKVEKGRVVGATGPLCLLFLVCVHYVYEFSAIDIPVCVWLTGRYLGHQLIIPSGIGAGSIGKLWWLFPVLLLLLESAQLSWQRTIQQLPIKCYNCLPWHYRNWWAGIHTDKAQMVPPPTPPPPSLPSSHLDQSPLHSAMSSLSWAAVDVVVQV